jgi:hypothetical protein
LLLTLDGIFEFNILVMVCICYLRLMLWKDGDINEDVSHRINVDRLKWCQVSCVLFYPRVLQKLKDKFYMTMIRSVMLYGAECWPTKR